MSGGGGGGGARMTALFSNAPPGTTRGPLFRFLQIGSTIPLVKRRRAPLPSPEELRQFCCCHTLASFHIGGRISISKVQMVETKNSGFLFLP